MKNDTFVLKTLEQGDKTQFITIEGNLSMKNAAAFKKVLQESEYDAELITLQIKNVEELDITTVQTLRALISYLNRKGKVTKLISDLRPDTVRLLINSGFGETL